MKNSDHPFLKTCLLGIIILISLSNTYSQEVVKIMSYNIHHGANAESMDRMDSIAFLIKASGADIIGLQEVDSVCFRSGKVDQAKFLAEQLGMHYAFVRHFEFEGGAYGQALLSKYPISQVENHRLPVASSASSTSVAFLTAQIELPNNYLTIGVAHLDYRSDSSRQKQAEIILNILENQGNPVFLLGDMNAEPSSKTIEILRTAFVDTQKDTILTFPAINPTKKIDFIFADRNHPFRVLAAEALPFPYSDHLPIVTTVSIW